MKPRRPEAQRPQDLASIGDIRIRDIDTYLELLRSGSVRELARNRNISPGQISKSIRALEGKLKTAILDRSSQGVSPSPEAEDILNTLYSIQKLGYHLADRGTTKDRQKIIGVASTSFFPTHLIPDVFAAVAKQNSQTRFRLIDLPPTQIMPVALRNGFQVCVHMGELEWPRTWTSVQVGSMPWVLCSRPNHPVLKNPSEANLLLYPFVYPIYWSQEGLRYGDDSCPVPINRRLRGTETATATCAAAIVARSDELAFLPKILAVNHSSLGPLEIISTGWKPILRPVYLTVKSEVTSQKTFEAIRNACQSRLLALEST